MYDASILYPSDEVTAYANLLLDQVGSRLRVTSAKLIKGHDNVFELKAKGVAGGQFLLYAPYAKFHDGSMTFRSILRPPYRGGTVNFLVGGQATGGTKQILHQGENGLRLVPSEAAVDSYFRSSDPTQMRHPEAHIQGREDSLADFKACYSPPAEFSVADDEGVRPLSADISSAPSL